MRMEEIAPGINIPTEQSNPDGTTRVRPPQEVLDEFAKHVQEGAPAMEAERIAWHNYTTRRIEQLEDGTLKEVLRGITMVLTCVATLEDPMANFMTDLMKMLDTNKLPRG